jgi:UDP-glucose 4-epimerase
LSLLPYAKIGYMDSKKVLITGAGGYIGSVSTDLLLKNGYRVVALDNFSNGYRAPLEFMQQKYGEDKLVIYERDTKDELSDIFEKEKDIKAVLHYAAFCKVNESMENPSMYFENNVMGSLNLFDAMIKYGVKNLVFSSTCAVYGEAEYVPIDTKHPTNPSNPYGESKLMVEKILKWLGSQKELNYVVLRYFNICGASDDGTIGDSKKPSVLLVQNVVRGALGLEPFYLTYSEVDTPDKSPIRDYINVVDLNEAHLLALEYLEKGGESETINLGTGTGNSVLEIVKTVEEITGKEIQRQVGEKRQGEYATAIADIKKAKEVLGWEPKRTVKDSVESLVKWYGDHPQGWEK